jgi:predicted murein hydrolase (TIGR00659 family)
MLTGMVATLCAYSLMMYIQRQYCPYPWAHPLILTIAILTLGLSLTDVSIPHYQSSVSFIHWLLGPITVALAVPIYQQWHNLKAMGKTLPLIIVAGGVIAPLSAWLFVWSLGAPAKLQLTMLVKSITTPLAMGAAQEIGGIPALAAVIVIITGIVGACLADWVFALVGVDDERARGIALGTVAHAVGTAKAVSDSTVTGAFASVALCVNGILTAVVLPFVFWLMSS